MISNKIIWSWKFSMNLFYVTQHGRQREFLIRERTSKDGFYALSVRYHYKLVSRGSSVQLQWLSYFLFSPFQLQTLQHWPQGWAVCHGCPDLPKHRTNHPALSAKLTFHSWRTARCSQSTSKEAVTCLRCKQIHTQGQLKLLTLLPFITHFLDILFLCV